MFCTHCGKNIPEGVRFCTYCGEPVEVSPVREQSKGPAKQMSAPVAKPKQSSGGSNKRLIAVLGICGGVIVLALLVLLFVKLFYMPTINLNDYIEVDYDGYNTQGRATVTFDEDDFYDDYESKLKFSNRTGSAGSYDTAAEYFLEECVYYSLDRSTGLSNSESVKLVWDLDEDAINDHIKANIKCKNSVFKVKGLSDAETIDIFANIDVTFSGEDGDGVVSISNNNTISPISSWSFMTDTASGLSNGDSISVYVENGESLVDACVSESGKLPGALTKEYSVSGLTESDSDSSSDKNSVYDENDRADTQGQIFPDSSSRLLTESEVRRLSTDEVQSAINEIYARNGYLFKSDEIYNFYSQYSWYNPVTGSQEDAKRRFNSTENANVELLDKFR